MITYTLILLIFLIIAIYGWKAPYNNGLGELCAIVGTVIAFCMVVGTFIPLFEKNVEKFDATSLKASQDIVVQSPGLPTQLVTDIKFLDKPLTIIKHTNTNLYGLNENPTYTVEIKNPDNR